MHLIYQSLLVLLYIFGLHPNLFRNALANRLGLLKPTISAICVMEYWPLCTSGKLLSARYSSRYPVIVFPVIFLNRRQHTSLDMCI